MKFSDGYTFCSVCGGATEWSDIDWIGDRKVCAECAAYGRVNSVCSVDKQKTLAKQETTVSRAEYFREQGHVDRIRFNWGYHDGASEQERGRCRAPVPKPSGEGTICREFDPAFFEGYWRGVDDAANGRYRENSDAAWGRFKNTGNKDGVQISDRDNQF